MNEVNDQNAPKHRSISFFSMTRSSRDVVSLDLVIQEESITLSTFRQLPISEQIVLLQLDDRSGAALLHQQVNQTLSL